MKDTKIRWANDTWNPMTGCSRVSPGCDRCYAEVIATKFQGAAFPNGFDPTWKPHKLTVPAGLKTPRRIFVNSMSDIHHPAFDDTQIDAVYDTMAAVDRHHYLVLTKRPHRMARFVEDWTCRRGLPCLPAHIWVGTTIESDRYCYRADHLRRIDAAVRFLSCEPLLEPLPSLDLAGIGWLIAGGESGSGWRPMNHDWCRDLRDRCAVGSVAFYFKQSAAPRTEMGIELDGRRHEEYPLPHPSLPQPDRCGVHVDGVMPVAL